MQTATAHNFGSYQGRPCYLHTLDGLKPARIVQAVPGRLAYTVAATDNTCTITVLASVVWGKYAQESEPTFYAC